MIKFIAPGIMVKDDAFPEVEAFLNRLPDAWNQDEINYGTEFRTCKWMAVVDSRLDKAFNDAFADYKSHIDIDNLIISNKIFVPEPDKNKGFCVLKYEARGRILAHVDDPVGLSASLFLNTGYEGGLFRFPDLNLTVECKAGSLVMFPSTMMHEITEVTKGERYSIVTWFKPKEK